MKAEKKVQPQSPDWRRYEDQKARIQKMKLSPSDYHRAVRLIARGAGV